MKAYYRLSKTTVYSSAMNIMTSIYTCRLFKKYKILYDVLGYSFDYKLLFVGTVLHGKYIVLYVVGDPEYICKALGTSALQGIDVVTSPFKLPCLTAVSKRIHLCRGRGITFYDSIVRGSASRQ